MKKKQFLFFSLIVFISFIFISACGNGEVKPLEKKEAAKVIKIGAILPLTGSGSLWGQNAKKGIELAYETYKESGKSDVKIFFKDSKSIPKNATTTFSSLIARETIKVSIVDMISSNVLAIAPIANKEKVLIMSPGASSPDITNAGPYVFRNWPSDAYQGKAGARFASEYLKCKSMAVFFINNEYGNGLLKVFVENYEKLGGTIVDKISFEQGTTDFKNLILKIKEKTFDGIYIIGYPKENPILVSQIKEANINSPLLGTEGFEDPNLLKIFENQETNLYYTFPIIPDSSDTTRKEFEEDFLKRFNEKPGPVTDIAFDAFNILVKAIDQVGYDADKIKSFLHNLKDYRGATGLISFDENGDAVKPFGLKQIINGELKLVSQ